MMLWRVPAGTTTTLVGPISCSSPSRTVFPVPSSIRKNWSTLSFSGALFNPEELVDALVNLLADVLARFEGHHDELAVGGGVEDPPKVLVP